MKTFAVAFLVAVMLLIPVLAIDAGGRGGSYSCGSCYYPSYSTYQQPYYPPERDLYYVESVQLYQPFEFRFVPPTALLTLYGVPSISSVTTTTTTTSAVSNGAVQQVAIGGGAAPNLVTNGVQTVGLGQPQAIGDGLPVAQTGVTPPTQGSSVSQANQGNVAGILKTYCAQCHGGASSSGGVTLLNANGQLDLRRSGGSLSLLEVAMAMEGAPGISPMPPASKNDGSKKVPPGQRKIIWDAAKKR